MPRSKNPGRTRESILNSALELFASKGFAQASMDEIAKRAGVTKGALYWHFDDKLALYRALVDHVLEMQVESMALSMRGGGSAEEVIEGLVGSYLNFYRDNALAMAFYSNMMMEGKTLSESGVMSDMAQAYRSYREAIASALAKNDQVNGINPDGAAAVLVGALDGIIMQWMMDPEGFDRDGAGEALIRIFSEWVGGG